MQENSLIKLEIQHWILILTFSEISDHKDVEADYPAFYTHGKEEL
jgi:hypothetical protein